MTAWHILFYVAWCGIAFFWLSDRISLDDRLRLLYARYRMGTRGDARIAQLLLEAGVRWTPRQYRLLLVVGGVLGAVLSGVVYSGRLWFLYCALGAIGVSMPVVYVRWRRARRRSVLIRELAKFSYRLHLCANNQQDVREILLRASRPLRHLRPYMQQLVALWGQDHRLALDTFAFDVGIVEAKPVMQALHALCRARKEEVTGLLLEHARNLDAMLTVEVRKQIETAPIWVSLIVMIPFVVCCALFLYPWMMMVMEQMDQGWIMERG